MPAGDNGQRRLLAAIAIGIAAGVAVGGWFPRAALHLDLFGDVFLNLLMVLVVPLVMLSMIVGISNLGDVRRVGAIGWRTLVYYLMTTAIAVAIGVVAVGVIRPGDGISPGETHAAYVIEDDGHTVALEGETWQRSGYDQRYVVILHDQGVKGTIERIDDRSVTVGLWEQHRPGPRGLDRIYITADDGTRLPFVRVEGQLISAEPPVAPRGVGIEIALPLVDVARGGPETSVARQILLGDPSTGRQGLIPRNVFAAMARLEVLPLIVFSLLIGAALSTLGSRGRTAVQVLEALHDAVMKLVHWVMKVAPIGIFALIAARIGRAGGFVGFWPELVALGKYAATVLAGLAIHGLVVLPLVLWALGRRSPGRYARGVAPALLNALSTSSSSATLPLTLEGVREENGVSNRTASFVLPLGATVNMDGTALYEAVAAIFIAQVYGIELDVPAQAVVVLTATLAAIGAAGIPEAGLVTMVIVLRAVGLPLEGIALLLAVDWLLDRARTTVNVWGDSVGAAVVERFLPPAQAGSYRPSAAATPKAPTAAASEVK